MALIRYPTVSNETICWLVLCWLLQFLQVLPIVLQHSPDDISPQTLCSLLQISGTCRQLLRQSRADCSIVSHMGLPALGTLLGFSRFASWLPIAPGLISRLNLSSVPETDSVCHLEVMQHLLLLALHATAAAGPSTAVTAAASKTPAGVLPLQLQHISLGLLASPAVVGALASTHVQHLEIQLYSSLPPALLPSYRALAIIGAAYSQGAGRSGAVTRCCNAGHARPCFWPWPVTALDKPSLAAS